MTTRREKRELDARQELIASLLGYPNWTAAYEGASQQFALNMLNNMRTLKVGLDASIKRVRDEVFLTLDGEPLDEERGETAETRQTLHDMFSQALEKAEEHMRERVAVARALVALADQ